MNEAIASLGNSGLLFGGFDRFVMRRGVIVPSQDKSG